MSSKTPPPAPVLDVRDFSVTLSNDVEQLTQQTFGRTVAASIKRAMALPPLHTTLRVNTLRLTREALLEQLTTELEGFNARLRASGRAAVVPFAHSTVPDVVVIPSAPVAPEARGRLVPEDDCALGALRCLS